jgi:multiple sugar transport system permease protein
MMRNMHAARFGLPWKSILTYIFAIVTLFYILAPFAWLVITSFMNDAEALSVPPHWIPQQPTLDNYRSYLAPQGSFGLRGAGAIDNMQYFFRNSVIVALCVAVLNVVFGTMAAYPLARMEFRGSGLLMPIYLASRMIPGIAIIIPLFLVIKQLHLLDSMLSLVITYTGFTLPFSIWILRSYFVSVPRDLEDAARVDRCNRFNMMMRIFLPVVAPALVATAMFAFVASWGEFLYAVIFTSTTASKTITVAVAQLATDIMIKKSLVATGGVLAVIIPICLALIFQRMLVQGIASGSVKG